MKVRLSPRLATNVFENRTQQNRICKMKTNKIVGSVPGAKKTNETVHREVVMGIFSVAQTESGSVSEY